MKLEHLLLASFAATSGCKKDTSHRPDDRTAPSPPQSAARTAQEPPTESARTASIAPMPEVALEPLVKGMAAPTDVVTAPDGSMYALDQPGTVYRIDRGKLETFADIQERVIDLDPSYDERGLLGMAFHPDWPEAPRLFLYYSTPLRSPAPSGYDHTNVLAAFEVDEEGEFLPQSEHIVLSLDWPAPNHDGGTLMFGPDRKLYVSLGDGGKAADQGLGHPPMGNGQDWTTLMGSILRIDPEAGDPYGIPADNPFVGDHPGADEIWAYGLRNPYAYSFDPETGRLFAGDVGQDLVEELDLIEKGKNYGWSIKEGTLCFDPDDVHHPAKSCPDEGPHGEPLVPPLLQYAQPDTVLADEYDVHGISIIGGQVYRGSKIPELDGVYVFGDWSRSMDQAQGVLLAARPDEDGWRLERLSVADAPEQHIGRYIRGFGQDLEGEVYVATSDRRGTVGDTGAVWRLTPAPSGR